MLLDIKKTLSNVTVGVHIKNRGAASRKEEIKTPTNQVDTLKGLHYILFLKLKCNCFTMLC